MGDTADRVATVQARISDIARSCGRDPGEIRIIGASKGQERSAVEEAYASGITEFGENYVQEAAAKFVPPHPPWRLHFIGHLQHRKVRDVPGLFDMVQTLDASRTVHALDAVMAGRSTPYPVAIEVSFSHDPVRPGISPEGVPGLLQEILGCGTLHCRGFMVVASTSDRDASQKEFAALRELRDAMERRFGKKFPELSMGMSGDYDLAIREGATMVRLGTAIFGPRPLRNAVER